MLKHTFNLKQNYYLQPTHLIIAAKIKNGI